MEESNPTRKLFRGGPMKRIPPLPDFSSEPQESQPQYGSSPVRRAPPPVNIPQEPAPDTTTSPSCDSKKWVPNNYHE